MTEQEQYSARILSFATDFWEECEQKIKSEKSYPKQTHPKQTFIVKGCLKDAYEKSQCS